MNFIDFDSIQSTPVCPKPNCTHTNPDECQAFGMSNHATVIGHKIFYFVADSYWNNESDHVITTDLWQADLDGSNRCKVDTFDNIIVTNVNSMALDNEKAYFIAEYSDVDTLSELNSRKKKYCLCGYDFASKEFTNYGGLTYGYNASATIQGKYAGGLYASSVSVDEVFSEKISPWNASDEEMEEYNKRLDEFNADHRESLIWRLDLNSGDLSESDMPKFENGGFVSNGLYATASEDGTLTVSDAEGHTVRYDSFDYKGGLPVNGYIFNTDDFTASELSTGKVYSLNQDSVQKFCDVIAYHDGYVLCDMQSDPLNRLYLKIGQDETFEE